MISVPLSRRFCLGGFLCLALAAGGLGQTTPPGSVSPAITPTEIYPFLDIHNLTSTQWTGAVSAAMEAIRLVEGPMSQEQKKKFEGKWAPMFAFPCPKAVEYLNKLNPLLGQYLAIRAVMVQTAIEFDAAWKEATTAAAMHFEAGIAEAMEIAAHRKRLLQALSMQMELVVKKVKDLGDPPDPTLCGHAKRKKMDDVLAQTRDAIRKLSGADPNAGAPAARDPSLGRWIQTKVDTTQAVLAIKETLCKPKVSGDNTSLTVELSGLYSDHQPGGDKQHPVSCTWKIKWDRPPVTHDPRRGWPKLKVSLQNVGYKTPPDNAVFNRGAWSVKLGTNCSLAGEEGSLERDGSVKIWSPYSSPDFVHAGGTPEIPYSVPERSLPGTWRGWKGTNEKTFACQPMHAGVPMPGATPTTPQGTPVFHYVLKANVSLGTQMAVTVTKIFRYEWDPTGATLRPDEAGAGEGAGEPAMGLPSARTPQERARIEEEIAMREESVKVLQKNLNWSQEQFKNATDPNTRAAWFERITGEERTLQDERDRIATLQSGQFVRTRTRWDEVTSARFIQKCQDEVNRFAQGKRQYDGMQRMASKASTPEQAARLREFINRHADPKTVGSADVEKLRKISHVVFNQIQGELEASAAASEEAAIVADRDLAYVQNVKSTCDGMMMVLSLGGGHQVMAAYEGITGFIEDPPVEPGKEAPKDFSSTLGDRTLNGLRRGLAWFNTATFVASEAISGYVEGGYIGGKESKGTLLGAVERAGEAFLMAKVCEWGVGKIFGTSPPGGAGGAGAEGMTTAQRMQHYEKILAEGGQLPKMTVKEAFELAQYRQKVQDGISLVDDYQRAYKEYQRAMEFGAGAGEIQRMEQELQRKASSMNSTIEAKMYLKKLGAEGKAADAVEDYIFRLGKNHEAVEKEWQKIMVDKGYHDVPSWNLRDFRNSSSAGSVGMDYDRGIIDKGRTFSKDYVRVSTAAMNEDAQKAWNEAYRKVTGHSAERSWETITTSVHKEAYSDLAWIGDETCKHVKVNEILAGRAGQAGDVTAVKAFDMFNDPKLTRLQGLVEASRGMSKDIKTKLLPVLEQSGKQFPNTAARHAENARYWQEVQKILDTAAADPIEADKKMRLLTGKSITEVVGDVRDTIAIFGKAVGKPLPKPTVRP